jgi:hypothetical protein
MVNKRGWADLTSTQQKAATVAGLVEVVLTTIAMRDLARRPRAQVRGPKLLWTAACVVQPIGPIAYLLLGRRTD